MKKTSKAKVKDPYSEIEVKSIALPEGDLRCPVCGTSCVIEDDKLLYIEGKKHKK